MSKTVVEYASRRITYETTLPIDEVIAKLDKETNKQGGGMEVFRVLRTSKTREELETAFNSLTGDRDFVYFMEVSYHKWLNAYIGSNTTPKTYVYAIGNPLIAQGMLRHDLVGALHVPPRILISELPDGKGTKVVYDDPAAMIPVPSIPGGSVNAEMKSVAEGLSQKLDALMQIITKE